MNSSVELTIVILCGGLGTRLRPAVADRPKVLAPVAGTPFLGHLLNHVAQQGFRVVVLSTGYLAEMIEEYVGDGSAWNLRVHYAREPHPLGTGGALRFAAKEANLEQVFLAMNGDTFYSGSLQRLLDCHRGRPDAAVTIALTLVEDVTRYGTVQADPDSGLVTCFVEKEVSMVGPAWINAGTYVIDPVILQEIAPGKNVSLEREVFPSLLGRGLYGCHSRDASFLDIGTPIDLARAEDVLDAYGT